MPGTRGVVSSLLPWSAKRHHDWAGAGGAGHLKPLPVPDSATPQRPLFGLPECPADASASPRCTLVSGLFLMKTTALSGPGTDSSPSSGCQAHDLKQSQLLVIVC